MAENRPGVMLYFETLQAIEELEAEDVKQILSAILHYCRDGEEPVFHGMPAALWHLIRNGLDRDGKRYNEKQLRGNWLTYCRKCKSNNTVPLDFYEWVAERADNDTLPFVERAVDNAVNVSQPSTSTTTSPSPSTTPTKDIYSAPDGAATPTPSVGGKKKPDRKQYGHYGWVKLSDEEYNRLVDDFGEAEVTRCITYIDESAQSSGNKNHWRDWNLVVRRCCREHWGAKQNTRNEVKTAADYGDEDFFTRKEDEQWKG